MARDSKREERERQREQGPPEPLHPDATDPKEEEPHHALANPASVPDPTEFPDPYERRPDPRGPEPEEAPGSATDASEPAAEGEQEKDPVKGTPRAPSTSEPPPPRNYDDLKPVKGDR